jgi:FdhE protein
MDAMTEPSRPRPERADTPQLAAFRRLKVAQPELATAVDMQVELVVLQQRVQSRVSTPWLDFDAGWLARRLGEGVPILRFQEVPFDFGELRVMFRQVTEVLRRYDVLEPGDYESLQAIIRRGRPESADAAAWFNAAAVRPRLPQEATPDTPEAFTQVLTVSARPFLGRAVESLHSRVDLAPWNRPYCPYCGGDPELAVMTPSGDRRLACGRCAGVWPFDELACPHCDDRHPSSRTTMATSDRRYQVVACDACKRYVKTYDARGADRPFMLDVDTIATLPLDAAAMQRGYQG